MRVGIVKEVHLDERRVAVAPSGVRKLIARGFEVSIESGAGAGASYPDEAYVEAGADLAPGPSEVWKQADIVLKVRPPEEHPGLKLHEADLLREGQVLISTLWPAQNKELVDRIAARKATAIAMDQIPRITRAQKMDVLSSTANIAGYRAVVEAANHFGSFFTGQITAAGKVAPAKVLIIGAGVAGLAALGAAKGLGAIVRAFDTREAVRDQVKSLGGEFLSVDIEESGEGGGGYARTMSKEFIDAEMKLFAEQAKEVDIVITTALIPGKPAPKLWKDYMVEAMKPGSVVVDLAAEQGGNCDLTEPGKAVVRHGVTIIGYTDMASRMANVSSDLFGTNLLHLLEDMGNAEGFHIDHEDEAVRTALIVENGEIMWPPPAKPAPPPKAPLVKEVQQPAPNKAAVAPPAPTPSSTAAVIGTLIILAMAGGWLYLRLTADARHVSMETHELLQHVTVFVLSVFVGWQVIWNVSPALHTPLMAVTNAISGIIIIGGMLQQGGSSSASVIIGAVATLFAAINVAGGFLVTQRMLKMFRK
jgi:NAD(P) transhydrogenase subunit alpha